MLSTFFEALYNKVIVNIVVKRASSDVYIEVLSKKSVVKSSTKTFETTSLNIEMQSFINEYIKESPYHYIALLNMSDKQGALTTCDKKTIQNYAQDTMSQTMCQDKLWTHYTAKEDINSIKQVYSKIGCDYIFSPFSLLSYFFKDKIGGTTAMFILMQDNFVSLAIFEEKRLLFAVHLDMQTMGENEDEMLSQDIDTGEDVDLGDEVGIDLEDVNVLENIEELEDIDDFGDIEDLDSIEEIDEFSQNQDIEEEFQESEETFSDESEDNFNEDYQRFSLIQSALGHYYSDEEYDSQFVENVYIEDGVGVSRDLKRYLEEEMFLNVYIRQASLGAEISELVKLELKL